MADEPTAAAAAPADSQGAAPVSDAAPDLPANEGF